MNFSPLKRMNSFAKSNISQSAYVDLTKGSFFLAWQGDPIGPIQGSSCLGDDAYTAMAELEDYAKKYGKPGEVPSFLRE